MENSESTTIDMDDKNSSSLAGLQQYPKTFEPQSLSDASLNIMRLEMLALQEDASSDSMSLTPNQAGEENKELQSKDSINVIQTKNGPWPTAINPKYLAGTQVGTMIAAQPSNTIIE